MEYLRSIALTALINLFSHSAVAIIVNESSDFGDFSNTAAANTFIGVLDAGANVISGSMSGTCLGVHECDIGVDPQDSIFFQVADGFKLDSIIVSSSLLFGPSGLYWGILLEDETETVTSFSYYNLLADGTINLQIPPLPSTGYQFVMGIDGATETGSYQLDYQINLITSPVPIPAGIWLFGPAVFILAGLRTTKS